MGRQLRISRQTACHLNLLTANLHLCQISGLPLWVCGGRNGLLDVVDQNTHPALSHLLHNLKSKLVSFWLFVFIR